MTKRGRRAGSRKDGDGVRVIDSGMETGRQSGIWWALDHCPAEIRMLTSVLNLYWSCASHVAHIQFKLDTFYYFLINPSAVRWHMKTHSGGRAEKRNHALVTLQSYLLWAINSNQRGSESGHWSTDERQEKCTCKTVKSTLVLLVSQRALWSCLVCLLFISQIWNNRFLIQLIYSLSSVYTLGYIMNWLTKLLPYESVHWLFNSALQSWHQ